MNKYEELRSMCSSSKILCGTDLYNLLEEDYMKELVSQLAELPEEFKYAMEEHHDNRWPNIYEYIVNLLKCGLLGFVFE